MIGPDAPPWLPPFIALTGNTPRDLATLQQVFDRDFTHGRPTFLGLQVWWNRGEVAETSYCEAFWHIVSRTDAETQTRVLDPMRAARISWCCAILANAHDSAVKVWDSRKGKGVIRTYAWLERFDYVVVLEKNHRRSAQVAFLVTAYHIDGDRSRKQLDGLYRRRIA